MMQARSDAKTLTFSAEVDPALPRAIYADEKRLRQVLINLLDNAVKFTVTGTVTLCVQSHPVTAAQQTAGQKTGRQKIEDFGIEVQGREDHPMTQSTEHLVRFEVIDSGIGIASAKIASIFEPFEQVRSGLAQNGGTGLGLAISRHLVALMGGTLSVQSQSGVGSRFWFDLIFPTAATVATPTPVRRVIGVKGLAPPIVVVDDHQHNRTLLRDFLAPLGFPVWEAADGHAALQLVYETRPAILLLDLLLPDMNGYELIHHLRDTEGAQPLVIIAISAGFFVHSENQRLPAHCDGFLRKPIDFQELVVTLQQVAGIEWLEAPLPSNQWQQQVAFSTPGSLPVEQLRALLTVAKKGEIGAIRRQLEVWAQSEIPAIHSLGIELQPLVQHYQIQKLVDRLTNLIKKCQLEKSDYNL